jgi:hypothetical protein
MGINGTNGYYIFKFNEKYYTFLNVYDSYPEWLGRKLVDELRQMGDAEFDRIKVLLEILNPIKYNCSESTNFTSLMETLEHPRKYTFWILESEPPTDIFVEYIYIIDLDKEIFKINHYHILNGIDIVKYKLKEIPADWYSLLE